MDINFFLYLGFTIVLLILTFTDVFYRTVDDRVIIAGIAYILICQFYLGQIIFSLTGAGVGFIISFCIFLLGNKYFSAIPAIQTEFYSKNDACLTLPLVPALAASVFIHEMLPDGLASFLFEIIIFIQSHTLTLITVIIAASSLLFWTMRQRKVYINADSGQLDEQDKKITAFGDGDITTSIVLGSALGWQNFIAVFWLAMVIHSIIGVFILLKRKGIFKWT